MKKELYQELLNRHYLVLEEKRAVFTKKLKKQALHLIAFGMKYFSLDMK